MFCTVAVVAIDLRDGRMIGANAGHHPMVVVSEDRTATLLEASGPPIGVVPEISWQDETATISPGETVMFYTDGIVEARSGATRIPGTTPEGEYGMSRLERAVRERYPSSPRQLVEAVVNDVHDYCAPMSPHDDCTMIALRYKGDG
jgi:serine phosphatase RsbU (regulator of sigma subunit)